MTEGTLCARRSIEAIFLTVILTIWTDSFTLLLLCISWHAQKINGFHIIKKLAVNSFLPTNVEMFKI